MIRVQRFSAQRISIAAATAMLAAVALLAGLAHWLAEVGAWGRLALGARYLLVVVIPAVGISLLVGIPLGLIAARVGRLGDRLVTRALEIVGGFPSIVLVALLRATAPDASVWYVAAILALVRVPETVRLVRLHTIRYRTSELYVAARALGASSTRVLIRHIFPTMAGSLACSAVMSVGILIGVEAAMTFVGLGAPTDGPTWGAEIGHAVASGDLRGALAPAGALALTIVACHQLAEGVRRWFGAHGG